MAKVKFNKLGLEDPSKNMKTVSFNEQEIEVKQFLPTFEKITLVETCVLKSISESTINPLSLDYSFDMGVLLSYTNLEFTDAQLKQSKTYDGILASGLFDSIWDQIPDSEKEVLVNSLQAYVAKIDAMLISMASGATASMKNFQNLVSQLEKTTELEKAIPGSR